MALLDLSSVTNALVRLLDLRANELADHVGATPFWPKHKLFVSPEPPDRLQGHAGDVLGLYLYHLGEDANCKNLLPPGGDPAPIRYSPMGLDLYYVLTAHSDVLDVTATYREQLMLGLAVKALHDFPIIDDDTTFVDNSGVTPVTHHILQDVGLAGHENRIRIVLQPTPPDHAVTYWTAGSSPLRLAAYYQVSVVLLEPEEAWVRTGRVLAYGVYTFPGGAPRLDGSRNVATSQIPGQTAPRQVELRPAQAPPTLAPPNAIPEESRVTFLGSNLLGDNTRLMLRTAGWDDPVEADANWAVVPRNDGMSAVIRETAGTRDVLPGVYGATVKVIRLQTLPGGQTRRVEHLSNEMPFAITPRVDNIARVGGEFTVTGYIFLHANLLPERVQVYVAEHRLNRAAAGVLNPGEFTVDNATTLRLRPPAGLKSGDWVPLRLFVNGTESLPRWIQMP